MLAEPTSVFYFSFSVLAMGLVAFFAGEFLRSAQIACFDIV
jgi:hypothetical protein